MYNDGSWTFTVVGLFLDHTLPEEDYQSEIETLRNKNLPNTMKVQDPSLYRVLGYLSALIISVLDTCHSAKWYS